MTMYTCSNCGQLLLTCPSCGHELSLAASEFIFDGEIRHFTYSCPNDHFWEREQVDWEVWAWRPLSYAEFREKEARARD
jgi:hypothetical protein